jgi:hypothetical protein
MAPKPPYTRHDAIRRALALIEEHCGEFILVVNDQHGRTVPYFHPEPTSNKVGISPAQRSMIVALAEHRSGEDPPRRQSRKKGPS